MEGMGLDDVNPTTTRWPAAKEVSEPISSALILDVNSDSSTKLSQGE